MAIALRFILFICFAGLLTGVGSLTYTNKRIKL